MFYVRKGTNLKCVTCDCFKAASPAQPSEPQQQLSGSFAGVILFYGARRQLGNESCRLRLLWRGYALFKVMEDFYGGKIRYGR